ITDVHVCNCKNSGMDAQLQQVGLICLCRNSDDVGFDFYNLNRISVLEFMHWTYQCPVYFFARMSKAKPLQAGAAL
ncbi:MAG: hypothetical protein IJZ34_00855, partial [Lachnospiraceae bacterium]|nr:hypothetical protein [Lachnospiraceae bacterium]